MIATGGEAEETGGSIAWGSPVPTSAGHRERRCAAAAFVT
jgi:hypothetical protein